MKTLKAICTTTILTLCLAISVAAGEISSPGYTPPPPPPDAQCTDESNAQCTEEIRTTTETLPTRTP